MDQHLRAYKLPRPVRELKFHPERKWQFDFAWPSLMLYVEIEGGFGRFSKSRHASKEGFANDQEKYNAATLLGWRKLAFTGQQVASGMAIDTILKFFEVYAKK